MLINRATMLSKNIKSNRLKRNWSVRELASRASCSASMISGYERGQNKPRPEVLKNIADSFGLTIDQLLQGGETQFSFSGVSNEMLKIKFEEAYQLEPKAKAALFIVIDEMLEKQRILYKSRNI